MEVSSDLCEGLLPSELDHSLGPGGSKDGLKDQLSPVAPPIGKTDRD